MSANHQLMEMEVIVNSVFSREVYALLGLPFDRVSLSETADMIQSAGKTGRKCFLSTPNLNFAIGCSSDEDFRASIFNSDLSIADGMPVIWSARLLGVPIRERVAGSDLFSCLRESSANPLAVYFFGGPDGAGEAAYWKLNAEAGGLRCVGFAMPGFVSVEEMSTDAHIDHINASGAEFLVVALGARKGQAWIERNRSRLKVPVISHLGAVVNIVAERFDRAPRWMQVRGLEWCWRIIAEPILWRRYLKDGLAFCRILLTQLLPGMLIRVFLQPKAVELSAARITHGPCAHGIALCLHGAWNATNLGPLRTAFAALPSDQNIAIDLSQVSYVDSAFVGISMLLAGKLRRNNKQLSFQNPKPAVRANFSCFGAANLLDTGNMILTKVRDNSAVWSAIAGVVSHGKKKRKTMAINSIRSAIAVALLMALTSIGSVIARPEVRPADTAIQFDLELMVPQTFGDWSQVPDPLVQVVNPQTRELLDKLYSQVLSRTFVSSSGYKVALSLAYGSNQTGEMQAHKPEVCYPAQGFKLHSNVPGVLVTEFGSLPVRRLSTSRGPRQEPVTYWFTVGDRAVEGMLNKRLVEIRYGLTGQIPDGLLFRVSSIDADPQQAYLRHESFVRQLLAALAPVDRRRLSGLGNI
jgi:N-acetylglucosaminyldiphosphoundecaprenol N-acetyl-beta-D-mannosaminyltransferase